MRTTLSLDDDVLDAVRQMAAARHQSIGEVVSDLVRRSLQPDSGSRLVIGDDGLPVIRAGRPGPVSTEDVARALDDE